jgi:uncharacterized protein (DUF111 family)
MLPVKLGWMHGSVYVLKAEYEPARHLAAETGIPVRDVLRTVEKQAWEQVKEGQVRSPP